METPELVESYLSLLERQPLTQLLAEVYQLLLGLEHRQLMDKEEL